MSFCLHASFYFSNVTLFSGQHCKNLVTWKFNMKQKYVIFHGLHNVYTMFIELRVSGSLEARREGSTLSFYIFYSIT